MRKFDIEKLIRKVGGSFHLTVLVQRRMIELKKNSPKLVDIESNNLMDIIYEEILQDKISLAPDGALEDNNFLDEYRNSHKNSDFEFGEDEKSEDE
ncbi:MAG: DNA-directed RNA polymerase subunit omega [Candidatus Brocadiae bacterium]|nr:DNA-directed RNA polymerase subunit omega [Candidatus Brocadiia bacterium]